MTWFPNHDEGTTYDRLGDYLLDEQTLVTALELNSPTVDLSRGNSGEVRTFSLGSTGALANFCWVDNTAKIEFPKYNVSSLEAGMKIPFRLL